MFTFVVSVETGCHPISKHIPTLGLLVQTGTQLELNKVCVGSEQIVRAESGSIE